MTTLQIIFGIICFLTIVIDITLILCWKAIKKEKIPKEYQEWPNVSILVAARNEEHNIRRCIDSVVMLDYPAHKLEVLIGDDASEDDTLQVLTDLARKYTRIKVISIREKLGNARGKANVLAQLAKVATGDFYFITDADIAVPQTWIKDMLRTHDEGTGIVTGITGIADNNLQDIDWLFSLGMIKVLTDINVPVTAMGNNMYITKEAYQAVGGYEAIPFSVTEDYELFNQVQKKRFKAVQLYNKEVLAQSRSVRGFLNLLNQRKRWMRGAVQLPAAVLTLLMTQALYYPSLIALLFLNVYLAAAIFVIKTLLQSLFITQLYRKINRKFNYTALLIYEFYAMTLSFSSSLFFLIPTKIIWKGRKY